MNEEFQANRMVRELNDSISQIASPDAETITNEKGGKQSDIPVRFDLIDGRAMFEMAKVLDHGAKKYGANNWRLIAVDSHLNHLLMHTFAYLAGDRTDDHLSHILCRSTFALAVSLQDETSFENSKEILGWVIKRQNGTKIGPFEFFYQVQEHEESGDEIIVIRKSDDG